MITNENGKRIDFEKAIIFEGEKFREGDLIEVKYKSHEVLRRHRAEKIFETSKGRVSRIVERSNGEPNFIELDTSREFSRQTILISLFRVDEIKKINEK